MIPDEFISFDDQWPDKTRWIIVTNNIEAKNAHGEMSHVWMVNFCQQSSGLKDGIVAFDEGDRKTINLSHWKYA